MTELTRHIPQLPARLFKPLAVVGGLYIAQQLFNLSTWTWTHLLRRGSIVKYLDKDVATWAVVTGSSAGIGKGFVHELASQGFNVVLHGRNKTKLGMLQDEMKALYPGVNFELLVLDADDFSIADMDTAVDKIKNLNIRILINNVAGGGKNEKPVLESFQHRTPENIDSWFNVTARFPTHLTRLLLPTLINKKSSLILNIGSGISDMSVAYLSVYAGLKSYLKHWSECLQLDLQADGYNHVEVISITVGQTATERQQKTISMTVPTSRQMARSSLAASGCGRGVVAPYFGHALQDAIVGSLPTFLTRNMILNISRQMKADERAGKIFQ